MAIFDTIAKAAQGFFSEAKETAVPAPAANVPPGTGAAPQVAQAPQSFLASTPVR